MLGNPVESAEMGAVRCEKARSERAVGSADCLTVNSFCGLRLFHFCRLKLFHGRNPLRQNHHKREV